MPGMRLVSHCIMSIYSNECSAVLYKLYVREHSILYIFTLLLCVPTILSYNAIYTTHDVLTSSISVSKTSLHE